VVTDALIGALSTFLGWVIDLMPDLTIPDALGPAGTVVGWISRAGEWSGDMAIWIPLGQAVLALAFLLLAVGTGVLIKLARIVASFFTAGGGAPAR
jgi:hypothetical protein